jgi:hypothetical protein
VQPPARLRAIEGFQEVAACDGPELSEYRISGGELRRQSVQPRLPCAGRQTDEVGRHVLHHQRTDEVRPIGRQTPRVQGTHRVADQNSRGTE